MLTESRNILRLIVSKFRLAVTFLHVSLLFFFSSLGCCQANYTNIILSWILGTIWQNSIVWLVNFRQALKFSVQLFHSLGIVKQMWVTKALRQSTHNLPTLKTSRKPMSWTPFRTSLWIQICWLFLDVINHILHSIHLHFLFRTYNNKQSTMTKISVSFVFIHCCSGFLLPIFWCVEII